MRTAHSHFLGTGRLFPLFSLFYLENTNFLWSPKVGGGVWLVIHLHSESVALWCSNFIWWGLPARSSLWASHTPWFPSSLPHKNHQSPSSSSPRWETVLKVKNIVVPRYLFPWSHFPLEFSLVFLTILSVLQALRRLKNIFIHNILLLSARWDATNILTYHCWRRKPVLLICFLIYARVCYLSTP